MMTVEGADLSFHSHLELDLLEVGALLQSYNLAFWVCSALGFSLKGLLPAVTFYACVDPLV